MILPTKALKDEDSMFNEMQYALKNYLEKFSNMFPAHKYVGLRFHKPNCSA